MAAAGAIREIKAQLQAQGGRGSVWIDGWKQKYGDELGCTPREFMERRPELKVVKCGGNKFEVMLANNAKGGKSASNKAGAAKGGNKGSSKQSAPMALANAPAGGKGWGSGGAMAASKAGGGGWNPLVAEAIREIRAQLEAQGGAGRVWVENWNGRFEGELGSVKDFLASRPDKFQVVYGPGNQFTVALAGAGGGTTWKQTDGKSGKPAAAKQQHQQQQQQGTKNKASPKSASAGGKGGWNPVVAEAIREIRAQLEAQGGAGQVRVDNWKGRFFELGSIKEFLESRPDKFELSYGPGNKFSVALAGAGGSASAPAKAKKENNEKPQGTKRKMPWEQEAEPKKQKTLAASAKKHAEPKKQKTTAASAMKKLAEQATREVEKQLKKESNTEGKVWINGWKAKYGEALGTIRDFLESKPDKFVVVPGEGNKYSVELAA